MSVEGFQSAAHHEAPGFGAAHGQDDLHVANVQHIDRGLDVRGRLLNWMPVQLLAATPFQRRSGCAKDTMTCV